MRSGAAALMESGAGLALCSAACAHAAAGLASSASEDQRQKPDAGPEPRERAGRQGRPDQCAFGSVTVKPGAGYS